MIFFGYKSSALVVLIVGESSSIVVFLFSSFGRVINYLPMDELNHQLISLALSVEGGTVIALHPSIRGLHVDVFLSIKVLLAHAASSYVLSKVLCAAWQSLVHLHDQF